MGDTNIYKTVVNETSVNPEAYGIEKSSNVYSIKKMSDYIGTQAMACVGIKDAIEYAMKTIVDNVTPEFTVNQTFSITSITFTPNYGSATGILTLTVSDGAKVPATGAVSVAGGANITSYSVSGNTVTVIVDSSTRPTSATITIDGTTYTKTIGDTAAPVITLNGGAANKTDKTHAKEFSSINPRFRY